MDIKNFPNYRVPATPISGELFKIVNQYKNKTFINTSTVKLSITYLMSWLEKKSLKASNISNEQEKVKISHKFDINKMPHHSVCS